jgi:hypothetical protein
MVCGDFQVSTRQRRRNDLTRGTVEQSANPRQLAPAEIFLPRWALPEGQGNRERCGERHDDHDQYHERRSAAADDQQSRE